MSDSTGSGRIASSRAAGTEPAAGSAFNPGDGLEVIGELGRGAHAAVYRVRRDGVDYALKALHRPTAGAGRSLLDFRREAALLARLDHPGVPKIFDVGQAGGRPYLVMELLDGGSLADLLQRGPLPEFALVRVGLQVASALAAAHRVALVHRDIKPANIVIGSDGAARLVDFGLAARGQDEHDDDGVAAGTFDYCAPEQAGMLRRPVDCRADLYSLGVVLFECATGVPPFISDDVGELIRLHAAAAPPDPRESRPELSSGCAAVIGRLLAKDPDDRYQSADDLCDALERLVPEAGVGTIEDRAARGRGAGSLVGRERERADLEGQWQRARGGDGGVALIEGGAGSGKSLLARELAAVARADGALVLAGKCDPDQPIPLAPLRDAVDRYVRSVAALPDDKRAAAVDGLRAAAGAGASLLKPLSAALAVLLDAPDLSAEDRGDQFATAVAQFLAALARSAGAMALQIDDVHWADPATRRVLRRLAADLTGTPLLILATARDNIDYADAVAGFAADAAERLCLRCVLGPLDDEGVARLLSAQLAGCAVSDDLVGQLAVRGGGNPFTTLEYLHALIDAGALRPSWGTWQLDADRLAAVELPSDVLDLVLTRIDGLGAQQRGVLSVAAAVGSRFRPDLVAAATDADPRTVLGAVRDAVDHRLVEAAGDVEFAFVHDRVREALLHGTDAAELRGTHQRIAEVLDRKASDEPQHVYAVAAHYAAGQTQRTPDRVFRTGWAAGQLALAENALAAAVSFLEPAAAAARVAGIDPDSLFRETLAQAYLGTGRVDAAKRELQGALESEREPLRRAALLLSMALAQRVDWDVAASIESCQEGLALIGHPMPRNPLRLLASTIWSLLLTAVSGKFGLSRLPADTPVEKRERIRLWAALNLAAAHTAGVGIILPILPFFSARAGWPASRVGPSPEYVDALVGLGMTLSRMRMLHRADRVFARAQAVAVNELGDPKLGAWVATMAGLGKMVGGVDHGQTWHRAAEEQRRWLDTGLYLNTTMLRCMTLVQRGYPREALTWYEHGMTAVAVAELPAGIVNDTVAVMARALLGDAKDAADLLAKQRHNGPDDPARLVNVVLAAVQCAYEQGELGAPFEAAIGEFAALGVKIGWLYSEHRTFYVYQALGRLAQYQRAGAESPDELPDRLAAAEQAIRDLRRAANGDFLRAYHTVARASLLQLRGEADNALALLARVEPSTFRLDAPVIGFEMARIRARALRSLGIEVEAQRQALAALTLATQHGWTYRARWVRTEFGVDEASVRGSVLQTRQAGTAVGDRNARRMAALQQVTRAAASVIDPQQLARVALDEALRILGAERALLFLTDTDSALLPAFGRDITGSDLRELAGFSSTLVDRVAGSREALVVTGSEEGAALGSQSAVVYGLRSIMVAPLEIDGRLLGVVYLDSRVAKGIFTADDIDILSAMTHPIAASLETTRAAQLDAAVQVAHRQRDLAETLRETMAELSAILDPDEVKRCLLTMVCRAAPADRAYLVLRDGDALTVTASDVSGPIESVEVDVDAVLASLAVASGAVGADVPAPVVALLGPVRCWATVPVTTQGHGCGALVVASTTGDVFTAAQIEIVAAIVGQGAAAYDNAVLFRQVQVLATTDGLTGISNRRYFTDLATRQLSIAERNHRPTVAVMLDIDHFKRINDTYGHGTGDEVIKAVASVVGNNLRDHDIFGRLGGEEFAVIMPEMHGDPIVAAERLRAAIEATTSQGVDGPVSVTVSIGVAELKPDDTLYTLLARADEALYRAKQGGRNQVKAG